MIPRSRFFEFELNLRVALTKTYNFVYALHSKCDLSFAYQGVLPGEHVSIQFNQSSISQLLLLEHSHTWTPFIKNTLEHLGGVHEFYMRDVLANRGPEHLIKLINEFIQNNSIKVVYLKVEFFMQLSLDLIQAIDQRVTKVLLVFDNNNFFEWNLIAASSCQLVLCGDTKEIHWYQSYGIPALQFHPETDTRVFRPMQCNKDLDVVFSGGVGKGGRQALLRSLSELIEPFSLEVIDKNPLIPYEKLNEFYNRAKIIVNFSHVGDQVVSPRKRGLSPLLQTHSLKGRVIEGFLSGTAVVSESFPSQDIMFPGLLTFNDDQSAAKVILNLLRDPLYLKHYTESLHTFVVSNYRSSVIAENLRNILNEIRFPTKFSQNCQLISVPKPGMRYRRLVVRFRVRSSTRFNVIQSEFMWGSKDALGTLLTFVGIVEGLIDKAKRRILRVLQ